MDNIEQLIADWIQVRATLKRQLKHFAEGNPVTLADGVSHHLADEATQRLHRCVTEIEVLITEYSIRD